MRAAVWMTVLMIAIAPLGCAVGGASPRTAESGAGGDRTGGIALEMTVRDSGGASWMYDVRPDGTLGFAGGADVINRRITWTGAMTDEEIAELRELIARHEWLTRRRSTSPGEGARRYSVFVRGAGAFERARFEVRGEREDVTEVNALLHKIALRRLEPELDRMPKPGPALR